MPVREHVRVETTSFAPGELPLSVRTFCVVSCFRIVTGVGIPLCLVGRVTAAFYNDRGLPVWSRRVLLCKTLPRNRHRSVARQEVVEPRAERRVSFLPYQNPTQDDDATSSTSAESQGTIEFPRNEHHQDRLHRHQHHTPVAPYYQQHRALPYHLHQPLPQYPGHNYLPIHPLPHAHPHYSTYLPPNNRGTSSSIPFGPNQPPLAPVSCPSSSSGHWYTSFNPQQRRWVNTWQPS